MRGRKAYKGMGMEGAIASWYSKVTLRDLNEYTILAKRLEDAIVPGARILEIAPGPGYLSVELARSGKFTVTGLDISKSFVAMATQLAAREKVKAEFLLGDAAHMPFADHLFDFIVCRAAFKNFSDPVGAIAEMHRVLKPEGQALIIDLRRDVSWKEVSSYVDGLKLSLPSAIMTKMTFKGMLMKRAYLREEMLRFAGATPFGSNCRILENPIGMEVWLRAASNRS